MRDEEAEGARPRRAPEEEHLRLERGPVRRLTAEPTVFTGYETLNDNRRCGGSERRRRP